MAFVSALRRYLSMHNLTVVERILYNRHRFFTEIRDGAELSEKIQAMLISCFVFLAIYGAVMGASHSLLQILASLLKLPVLFLATLAICTPSLHYFNILFGSKQTMRQSIALILTAISTSSVLMFSLAPVTLFFVLTTRHYPFFKLLNVTFFVISGFLGIVFLIQGIKTVTKLEDAEREGGVRARRVVFFFWAILYSFVGSQMAWTLRPFIGAPGKPFVLFLQLGGNIYADVISTIGEILGY